MTISINNATSATTLVVAPNPVTVGHETSLTATVTGTAPRGEVEFFAGGDSVGTAPLAGGEAVLPVATFAPRIHQITAAYLGDAVNAGSSSDAVTLTVEQVVSSIALGVSPNPVTVGEETVLVATVTGVEPTATVSFFVDGTLLGSASVDAGQAALPVTDLPEGAYEITAEYAGDVNHAASVADAVTLTVRPIPSGDGDSLAESGAAAPIGFASAAGIALLAGMLLTRRTRHARP